MRLRPFVSARLMVALPVRWRRWYDPRIIARQDRAGSRPEVTPAGLTSEGQHHKRRKPGAGAPGFRWVGLTVSLQLRA